ncbi:MAG: N-acetylmuramoyl-L-alanine amidase, partial [Brevundimonas sp.]
MSALAAAVTSAAVLTAGLSLARGSDMQIKSVRFGGDAQRTRVVIDLDRETRGRVVSDGANGEVAVALAEIDPGRGLSGNGAGLVRAYNLQGGSGGARINLSLARGATVERRFLLPPGDGVAHYRYVIDLKATGAV